MQLNVQETRREVERYRLQHQARMARGKGRRFYFTMLASVGRRLTVWGRRLQERYNQETTSHLTQSASSQASS
jgi:hypothetical protein